MGDVKTWVDSTIAGKKVVVFSKSTCPYCKQAKSCIRKYIPDDITEDDLDWIEIDGKGDCQQIQDYLKQLTGARSVRLFIFCCSSLRLPYR